MKKSEIMVSMPMTTYEELLSYKESLAKLKTEVLASFNYSFAVSENRLEFNTNDALVVAKSLLPIRYKEMTIIKTE